MVKKNKKCVGCFREEKCFHDNIVITIRDIRAWPNKFNYVDPECVCKEASDFGNSYLVLQERDIERLKSGDVICLFNGEYCTFVAFQET